MRLAPCILALALCAALAATSAAKPRIAYQRITTNGTTARGNLFTMRPDGTDVFQVTHNHPPVLNNDPDWKPDHKQLVFQSRRPKTANLWIVKSSGRGLTQLTHGAPLDADPAWAPDGKRIAFARANDQSHFDLFTIHPDGSGVRKLTHGGRNARSPDWSPDGRSIAFERTSSGEPPQVWRMRSDGTHMKRLTDLVNGAHTAAWSPDGRLVAFWSPKGLAFEIFVVPAGGGTVKQVTHDGGGTFNEGPAWSPDSNRIVFSTSHSPPGGSNIVSIKPSGHGRHVIKGDPRGQKVYRAPAWD